MPTGRRTIQDIVAQCKTWLEIGLDELGVALVVILVGVASFGLGRMSALEAARPAVTIADASTQAQPPQIASGGLYVASRTGSAYYFPWCTGAGKITTQNQRWFKSEEVAQAAGYRPAKNCEGLARLP